MKLWTTTAFGFLSRFLVLVGFFTVSSVFAQSCFEYRHSTGECATCSWSTNKEAACQEVAIIKDYPAHSAARLVNGSCQLWQWGSYVATYDGFQTRPAACPTPIPTAAPTPAPCPVVPRSVQNVRTVKNEFTQCIDGCTVSLSGCNYAGDQLVIDWFGSPSMDCKYMELPGKQCTAPKPPDPPPGATPLPDYTHIPTPIPLPKDCKAGQCYGEVNGVGVCVRCTPTDQTTKTTTVTNADGSTTTTISTTTCDGGKCTTTITKTTTPAGSSGGGAPNGGTGDPPVTETTKTDEDASDFCTKNPKAQACKDRDDADKKDFCEENPNLSICKTGTFDGATSCGSTPTCTGDAIQCAQALQAFKTQCAIKDAFSPLDAGAAGGLQGIFNTAIAGGDRPSSHPANSGVTEIASSTLDKTNPYSSSCPADFSFSVGGRSVTVPLSNACPAMELMGALLVGLSMLISLFILFKL